MIQNLIFALACVAIAATIQHAYLGVRSRKLKAKEQAFEFHKLRDDLQLHVIEERLETSAPTYQFLMFTLNTAIRNAGILRLSDILLMATRVDKQINKREEFTGLMNDIRSQDQAVRELAARVMIAFGMMLVSNDFLARIGFTLRLQIETGRKFLGPVLYLVNKIGSHFLEFASPTRVEAVKKAREYNKLGHRMASC